MLRLFSITENLEFMVSPVEPSQSAGADNSKPKTPKKVFGKFRHTDLSILEYPG
jgi:hypothetical protein